MGAGVPGDRPTLQLVAARAGVSRATASRVVNGSSAVSTDVRKAVQQAIGELGYVPNQAARRLATHRTDAFALVLSEAAERAFSDDLFFPTLVQGAIEELEAADKELVLLRADGDRSRERIRRYAAGGYVDGVLIASMQGTDPLPGTLARMGVPVVVNGRPLSGPPVPCVDVANVDGARLAVRRLVDTGRRRIATIAGPQDMVAGIDRLTGYCDEMRDSGRPPIVAVGDFTRESGAVAMRRLLVADPGIDAVFVASDMMALGALQALRQAGRSVPDDVAVVGFDDIDIARYSEPPLTTVRQPTIEMGREMVRLVLKLSVGEPAGDPVILPTKLVVRESA
jgi:DNA-binding LacI/PurR family transcriptional regulator